MSKKITNIIGYNKTPLEFIYQKTAQAIFEQEKKNSEENIDARKEKSPLESFELNRLVKHIAFNTKIEELQNIYHSEDIETVRATNSNRGHGTVELSSYLEVFKIGNKDLSYDDAMQVVRTLRLELKERLYGILFSNHKFDDINPLHPIIANEMNKIEDKDKYDFFGYTVVVYVWKDNFSEYYGRFPKLFKENRDYIADIISLVSGSELGRKIIKKTDNFRLESTRDEEIIAYNEKTFDENGNELINYTENKNRFIVPGQIFNMKGVMYPHYGCISVNTGYAWNLSPILATNIDHPGQTNLETGSEICTKVGSSATAKGCMTLNHSNGTSQRNDSTLSPGCMVYTQRCMDVSLSIIFEDYKMPEEINFENLINETKEKEDNSDA